MDNSLMKLYSFFRSGTSHRLRIALNLKGIAPEYVAVDLRTEEHLKDAFRAINPQGLVPALDIGDQVLTQSTAIIEWLEECYPSPALLPTDPQDRAYVRALASLIGCDVHPINNKRILEYLRKSLGANEEEINTWCRTWITEGFDAYEAFLRADKNRKSFSFGDKPSLADVYLIPQIDSSKRFKVDLTKWPLISEVEAACMQLEAFKQAAPMMQPDAS
jgi:maleylpyruvate isomerase